MMGTSGLALSGIARISKEFVRSDLSNLEIVAIASKNGKAKETVTNIIINKVYKMSEISFHDSLYTFFIRFRLSATQLGIVLHSC